MRPLIRRALAIALVVGWSALPSGCTVADNLSANEILQELDGIVRIDGTGAERRVVYVSRAEVSNWYMRAFLLLPMRGLLGWAFGRSDQQTLEHPSQHARELLRELPDEIGSDLLLCAYSCSRFGWLAELDRNPETRVMGIDGLATISGRLELDPFGGSFEEFGVPADAARVDVARNGVHAARPEVRAGQAWTMTSLEPYRTALQALTERPLEHWTARLLLVEDLTGLYADERDDRARPWVESALRAAITHCVRGVLLRTIQGRDPDLAEVRLCALEQMRRLGGPRTVPLMLAVMAASPAERARGDSRFDPDPMVQLRLIHYCGQLDAQRAATVVRLPGRADWEATSPADFLASTVLTEQDYLSKLRTPAIVALAWCLRRPTVDPDPEWVREWRETRP